MGRKGLWRNLRTSLLQWQPGGGLATKPNRDVLQLDVYNDILESEVEDLACATMASGRQVEDNVTGDTLVVKLQERLQRTVR